ncbi:S-adenosyl-L-methionine-dependent methyltransferase [Scenedesmus sp. NREL 46B-D3]|nr:S-adenosyl-L-methionine-dependent methyltransferase [Scenedesmus sp. NREL 46B-D3]
MTCAKLFSGAHQALCYAQHRPTYPEELYSIILEFDGGPKSLAVDVACGSGQATTALAELYARVVAQDGSEEQLQHAMQLPNIDYQHRDAHETGLPDQCADLVTVAQALHWFRHGEFYKEVRRILKPSGTFAAWTYSLPILNHRQHPAQALLLHLYEGVLGPYWAERRRLVEAGYRGIEPGVEHFGLVLRRELETQQEQSVDDLLGYLRSWSAYETYRTQHPERPDPVLEFKQQLLGVLGARDSLEAKLNVITPLTLIMAKEPMPLSSADA